MARRSQGRSWMVVGLLVPVTLASAWTSSALAATARVSVKGGEERILYRDGPGQNAKLAITGGENPAGYELSDPTEAITAGAGCSGGGAPGVAVRCSATADQMRVILGDGYDKADASALTAQDGARPAFLVLLGGAGPDVLAGTTIAANLGGDRLLGGGGLDTADYSPRSNEVYVNLDGLANDGQVAFPCCENDDVETENVITGSGSDSVFAVTGDGRNTVRTGAGQDQAETGDGADTLSGGDGSDALYGEGGGDDLDGGRDPDYLYPGPGSDVVDAVDGGQDLVRCDIHDGVRADTVDEIHGRCGVVDYPFSSIRCRETIVTGTEESDSLVPGYLNFYFGYSSDLVRALGGDDAVASGPGTDCVFGGDGGDSIDGGPGGDRLRGGAGKDALAGGAGADFISGGDDDDEIDAHEPPAGDPAAADRIVCGDGQDTVRRADPNDRIAADCEIVS